MSLYLNVKLLSFTLNFFHVELSKSTENDQILLCAFIKNIYNILDNISIPKIYKSSINQSL